MHSDDVKFTEKKVDESWKEHATREKTGDRADSMSAPGGQGAAHAETDSELLFSQFLTSLAVQALIHFGEIENPEMKAKTKNMEAAKGIIDLLLIFKQKTSGRLTPGEIKLLDSILADLQMKFVELAG